MRIPLVRPRLPRPELWSTHLNESYEQHQFTNFGPAHERFSAELTSRLCPPGREATLTSSCTIGIAAALVALRVHGPVAIPSFTFAATAQAVRMAGCEPVYVDSDPDHWHISREHLARTLEGGGVSAVLAVRVFGLCLDLGYAETLCRDHGVPLIVDAAAALPGDLCDGRRIGGQGDAEVFSLHSTKVFAIGEGGLIVSRPDLKSPLRCALNFGMKGTSDWGRGFNGKMPEVCCAVGLEVLKSIGERVARGRQIADWYRQLFSGKPLEQPGLWAGSPPWQMYPVLLPSREAADEIAGRTAAAQIEVRRGYGPALHAAFGVCGLELPVAASLAPRILCFPVLADMTPEEQGRIAALVETLCAQGEPA